MTTSDREVRDGARQAQGRQGQEGQAEEVPLIIFEEVLAKHPNLVGDLNGR